MLKFATANIAFHELYDMIIKDGVDFAGTKALFNVGFEIRLPRSNKILDGKLDMSVVMRSNDLWYGFCNDQYQFSTLQMYVADELNLPVGIYYHFAHNLHLYNDKI